MGLSRINLAVYRKKKKPWVIVTASINVLILHGISNETVPIGGLGTTLWTARLYLTKNGKEIDKDPNYDYTSCMQVDNDGVLKLNKNREPRFYADLGYDRGPYEISNANGLDTITIKMRFQGKNR